MRYLLDTHALLWYFEDSPKLPETVAVVIEAADRKKFVSVVSLWEFSIKNSLERLHRIFIDICGLSDELTPEVADKDVTVRRADLGCEISSLIDDGVKKNYEIFADVLAKIG